MPGQPRESWFVSGPGTQFGEDWRTVIGRHPADQGPWCPPGGPPGEQHPPHPKAQSTLSDGGIPGKGSEVFTGTAGAAGEMQPCSAGGGGADPGFL